MASPFAMRDRIGRDGSPQTFETIENELERVWAAIRTLSGEIEAGTDADLSGFVTGPASAATDVIALFADATGKLLKAASGTGIVHATAGVYSVGLVDLASEVTGLLALTNLALDGDATHVLHGDGSLSGITHALLSSTHTDTDAANPVAGDIIRAKQTDVGASWVDGAPLDYIPTSDTPGTVQFWGDGAAFVVLGTAVQWERVALGAAYSFLASDGFAPGWSTPGFTPIPFDATNFAGLGGMTLTLTSGDQTQYGYLRLGTMVFFNGTLDTCSSSGGNASFTIKLPNGWVATRAMEGIAIVIYVAGAVKEFARCFVDPGFDNTKIFVQRMSGTWAAATDDIYIRFQLWVALA